MRTLRWVQWTSVTGAVACLTSGPLGAGECPGGHCGAKSAAVNEMCRALGQAGGVVFVEHEGGYCYCKCSCVSAFTPVAVGNGDWEAMGALGIGDRVQVYAGEGRWRDSKVVFSDGTNDPDHPLPYAIFVVPERGTPIIATGDHPFFLYDGSIRRADRLSQADELLGADGRPVKLRAVVAGAYRGPIHNIVASQWESEKVEGHQINTAGIVSGDYAIQLTLTPGPDAPLVLGTPQVGTPQWLQANEKLVTGNSSPEITTAMRSFNAEIAKAMHAANRPDGQQHAIFDPATFQPFVPYQPFMVPKDACAFLPEGSDIAKPELLRPLTDTVAYEIAVSLTLHLKRFFPDIVFEVAWADDRVNAYAWRDGNVRHVAIMGGLVRHSAIGQEAIGLVLCHEVGHHLGGLPRYPNIPWASCEGQADYWGAAIGMRTIWWGQYAMEQTAAGAEQLHDLFANGLVRNLLTDPALQAAGGACGHPPADCRLATYRAAMRLDPKPTCAGLLGPQP